MDPNMRGASGADARYDPRAGAGGGWGSGGDDYYGGSASDGSSGGAGGCSCTGSAAGGDSLYDYYASDPMMKDRNDPRTGGATFIDPRATSKYGRRVYSKAMDQMSGMNMGGMDPRMGGMDLSQQEWPQEEQCNWKRNVSPKLSKPRNL